MMIRQSHAISIAGLWVGLWASSVSAQELPPLAPVASQEQSRVASPYVDLVEVHAVGAEDPIAPPARPLFSYSDSARRIAEGGIWAWGPGRPLVMMKSWKNPTGTRTRAFSLTSEELAIVHGPQAKIWKPEKSDVAPAELRDAPAPDRNEAARLRQLKEQARRFTAHEFWEPDNTRSELRLLIQPVHRYRDQQRQIVDGAVFLLAVDDNPQILLLIEMLSPAAAEFRWQYLLARVSSAELHVALDGHEVWTQDRTPGIVGHPSGSYWHMVTLPTAVSAP